MEKKITVHESNPSNLTVDRIKSMVKLIIFVLLFVVKDEFPNSNIWVRLSHNLWSILLNNFFRNFFFPWTIIEWNKLDVSLRKCDGFSIFKKEILKLIQPKSFHNWHNLIGIKCITRIRLGLSHLQGYKFKHSLQDSINPICNFGNDVESVILFFLHCPLYSDERCTLLNSLTHYSPVLLFYTPWKYQKTFRLGRILVIYLIPIGLWQL